MPAYDRPLVINVPAPARREQHDSIGAVVNFKSTDLARVQAWLDRAAEAGIIERTQAHTYNGEYGGPVWYIP